MRRRTSREVALSRALHRPQAKGRDDHFPLMMPDKPGMTLAAFWKPLGAPKKRKAVALRPRRPRLLDPVFTVIARAGESSISSAEMSTSKGHTRSGRSPL